ncbi:DUF3800 domain-containing protein [Phaeobacter piscinae]|uniref:DUF3800 domain-containing protein n=1 Tax=Phaeobacter piscinae TaxID=1580596 RepID=UPI000BBE3AD3|nr:DUF3800 domain-containing protein [Phaeobacter piscinae]ATG41791.1 hypothetical protein PhaeoP14_03759 [Phaeobacter piscinae]AUR38214.1 hypothetical protein PhaeoP18_03998 [Phaeobacter piscinae]
MSPNDALQVEEDEHAAPLPTLYIFLDEGGNFDFSPKGSKFFTLTCVSLYRPFTLHTDLDTYKYDLIEHRIKPRLEMEYFHCAEDNRFVRSKVFSKLSGSVPHESVDSVIVEKRKTGPALQAPEKFYPKMLGYLVRYAVEKAAHGVGEVVVITDSIPVAKKRKAIEKAVKTTLAAMLPKGTPYRIMHHASRAHYGLQIADYFNWAIFRKWENGDTAAHTTVAKQVRSEFDIFRTGTRFYY